MSETLDLYEIQDIPSDTSNMLVIKSVEVYVVNGDVCELHCVDASGDVFDKFDLTSNVFAKTETVYGKEFVNYNGQRVRMGIPKRIQEFLGIPFEVIDNLQKEIHSKNNEIFKKISLIKKKDKKIEELEKENSYLQDRLELICNLSFLERLKFLFRGKV